MFRNSMKKLLLSTTAIAAVISLALTGCGDNRSMEYESASDSSTAAEKPSIVDEGEKIIRLGVQRGVKTLRVRACAVRRPLLAVADLNDQGWHVHCMAKNGAWAAHSSGEVVSFQRVGGRFEFEASVLGDGSGNDPGQARL